MKIIKMCVIRKYSNVLYYCLFDEMPEVTYERNGLSYVGSAVDENGNIILSHYLKYDSYGNAFGGHELNLHMKNGTIEKVKDYWFDYGSYPDHGEFIDIGAGTLESLQNCYVYSSCNINKKSFEKMLDEYYAREKEYDYGDIEKWCKLQYRWHDVIIDGVKYPYMVNKKGDFVEKYTKKYVYGFRENIIRINKYDVGRKYFPLCIFKLSYFDGYKMVKIERNMLDVLKESMPEYTKDQIIRNCRLNVMA